MIANSAPTSRTGALRRRLCAGLLIILFASGLAGAPVQNPAPTVAPRPDSLATLRPDHPRLLLTDAELAANVAAARTDPIRAALHARILANAEAELSSNPITHELSGRRLLRKSRTCVARVLSCALAYRLGGDMRFAARAKREMLSAAAFPDWNPAHFLDVSEMSLAVAIGYDWLYAQLTASERAAIKQALLKHALVHGTAAYARAFATAAEIASGQTTETHVARYVTAGNNWNQVVNGGLVAAALAIADEERDVARAIIAGARRSIPYGMAAYVPDGAYPEGPGYWDYGTTYSVLALALLESALGTDFQLGDNPAFARTALYRVHVQSPSGLTFNYADGSASIGPSAALTWLAQRYEHSQARVHSHVLLASRLADQQDNGEDRFFTLHAVWFPQPRAEATPTPFDIRFGGPAELALFRSAWNDARALFVGVKAGRNNVGHAHLDLGSFVLDADGVRWAHDLGPDNYDLPGYTERKEGRWRYFRMNNRSHNTLTPGDLLQDPNGEVKIVAYRSTPAQAFAIADLTPAYPSAAKKILRGVAVLDRARVLVQDELTGLRPGTPLSARLMTGSQIKLDGERRATLTQDDRTLHVEILAPADARLVCLPATPPTSLERKNEGMTILAAELISDTPDVRLAMLLSPVGENWTPHPLPPVAPLENW